MDDGLQVASSKLPEHVKVESDKQYWTSMEASHRLEHSDALIEKNIMATRRRGLWPLLATVAATAIIVGAAVGGGVGSQLHKASTKSQGSHTVTVTHTATATVPSATSSNGLLVNYAAAPIGSVDTVALDCPSGQTKRYTTRYDSNMTPKNFNVICGRNIAQASGVAAAELVAYHVDDCIEACGAFTDANNKTCQAMAFHIYLWYNSGPTFNCWLFTGDTRTIGNDNDTASAYLSG